MDALTGLQWNEEYKVEFFCEGSVGEMVMLELRAGTGQYDEFLVAGLERGSGLAEWNAGSPPPNQRVAKGDRVVEVNGVRGNTSAMLAALGARNPRELVSLRFQRCATTRADEQQVSFEVRVWNPDREGLACFRVMEFFVIDREADGVSISGQKTLVSYSTGEILLRASIKFHDRPGTGLSASVQVGLDCSEMRAVGLDENGDEVQGSGEIGSDPLTLTKFFSYVHWR
jgi:hypothetical protein